MKIVLTIIGTRPEAIKLAPVIHVLQGKPEKYDCKVCLTGQHKEMLYQAVEYFDVKADYDLKLMKTGQTLSQITAALVENLQQVLDELKPDIILVQGDTTSAFIGGLSGYYNKIKVGHVEAGLRTDNKFAPFPEEMNRRLVGVLADYHFAPTERAQNALVREGVSPENIIVTGNTVIDALFYTLNKIEDNPPHLDGLEELLDLDKKIILITGHRRENFGEGFLNICKAIRTIANRYKDVNLIYPVHLNPNVQKPVYEILGDVPNIFLVNPMGYVPFVKLMNASHIVLTDSGGIQEEAPSLGKPVLVMRDVTERQEAVEAGTAILVGTNVEKIIDEVSRLIMNESAWQEMSNLKNPFGDGMSAQRIEEFLSKL